MWPASRTSECTIRSFEKSNAAAASATTTHRLLFFLLQFAPRHLGPREADIAKMLSVIPGGYRSLDDLVDATVPDKIKLDKVCAGLCLADRPYWLPWCSCFRKEHG